MVRPQIQAAYCCVTTVTSVITPTAWTLHCRMYPRTAGSVNGEQPAEISFNHCLAFSPFPPLPPPPSFFRSVITDLPSFRCVSCVQCGATTPGLRCEWQNNYTQCAPCASIPTCPICLVDYSEGTIVVQCRQCDR